MKRTAVLFSISSILKSGASMIAGLIMIRWVDPYEIGLWQSVWVFSSYTGFLQLGVTSGLNREIPFYLGAGKKEHALNLAGTGEFFALFLTLSSLIVIVGGLFIYNCFIEISPQKLWAIAGVGLIVATNFYQNYLVVTYRSNRDFQKLSVVYLFNSGLILILLLLIYKFGYYGIILYYCLNAVIITVFLYIKRPLKVKPAFSMEHLTSLIRVGFPMFSLGYLKQVSKTFPRIILLSVGGVLAVGYFAPAQAIQTAMLMLPNVLAQYIYPQMSFKFGQTNNKNELWQIVRNTIKYLFIFGTPLVVAGWFLLPHLITAFFPKYEEGILPAQLIMISGLFMSSVIVYNAVYSIKAFRQDLYMTVVMLALNAVLPLVLALTMKPIVGVALGYLLANVLFFIFMMLVLKKLLNSKSENGTQGLPDYDPIAVD